MKTVDDFLIDRLFQPVVDAMVAVASCYAIAAFVLTGGGFLLLVVDVHQAIYASAWWWCTVGIVSLYLPTIIVRAYRLEQDRPRDAMPIDRVSMMWFRVGVLYCQTIFLPMDVMYWAKLPWNALADLGWWLVIVGAYFMACRRAPPKQKRAYLPQAVPHMT